MTPRARSRCLLLAALVAVAASCAPREPEPPPTAMVHDRGTPTLVAVADSPQEEICGSLGVPGPDAPLHLLAALLDSPDVEWCAARLLGQIGDSTAAPALRAHLRAPDGGVNLMAVWALGEVGNREDAATLDLLRVEIDARRRTESEFLSNAAARLRQP
jgi:HEAT repeats